MSETTVLAGVEVESASAPISGIPRQRRIFALCVVILVSFAHFVASSLYYALGGTIPAELSHHPYRLASALIAEITSLLLLWYVLWEQGRSWKDIGLAPTWMDIPRGLGLMAVAIASSTVGGMLLQLAAITVTGHYLRSRSVQNLLGFGVTALSVAFIVVNPFFEELIVRGYFMSELTALGTSRAVAVLASVAVQVSYHLYQGGINCVGLAATFTVLSLYFVRTRRIAPVILVHLWFDLYGLIRAGF